MVDWLVQIIVILPLQEIMDSLILFATWISLFMLTECVVQVLHIKYIIKRKKIHWMHLNNNTQT